MSKTHDLKELQSQARQLRADFEETIKACRAPLWRYCLRLTGSVWDAEDLAQETVLKALAKLHQFGQALDPRAYLFRIASNAWIDQCRRARPSDDLADFVEALPAPPMETNRMEVSAAMRQLVGALSPRQRVVYLLIEGFDFTAAEVAAMLRTTEGGVKALLHRARMALRRRATTRSTVEATTRRGATPAPQLIQRYLDAFNRRDADALAALFQTDATTEIVGDWEEHGVETMRKYSLAFWAAAPVSERAEYGLIDGREVVLVIETSPDGTEGLSSIVALEIVDDALVAQHWYYYCPELVEHAASALGVPAVTHGYRYEGPLDP